MCKVDSKESTHHNIIEIVLQPYRLECRHLNSIEFMDSSCGSFEIEATARFKINPSWYIQSTGHFNAVDAILCFNQMGYVCIDKYFSNKSEDSEAGVLDLYRSRRLSDMVIAGIDLNFVNPIKSSEISANIRIVKSRRVKSGYFFKFEGTYYSDSGGSAEFSINTMFVL